MSMIPDDFDDQVAELLRVGAEELEAESERVETIIINRRWFNDGEAFLIEIETDCAEDAILAILTRAQHQWLQGAWEQEDEDEDLLEGD